MKIFCIGRNYTEHAMELLNEIPESPVVFMKPETALFTQGNDFYLPEFSNEIHYEVEVVVKINKMGKHIQPKFAPTYYDHIALGIDFTARDVQQDLKQKGLPWEKAKAFDNSAFIGKFQSKKNYDLEHLHFTLHKNDIEVQNGNTQQMMFSIDEIIVHISKYFSLKKGDLIYTGTPKGVGKVVENDVLKAFLNGEENFSVTVQ